VSLVKATVNQLLKDGQLVTIEAICRKSIELDPEERGVKKSALLENLEAHAYYQQHSASYKTVQARKRKSRVPASVAQPQRIDPHRNVDRARYRYLQMTKPEIVERLLTIEQAFAELAEQQARLQFELLEIQQCAMEKKNNNNVLVEEEDHDYIVSEESEH